MFVTARIKLHIHNYICFFVCMYVYMVQFVCMNVYTLQFMFGLFSLYLFVHKLQSLRLKPQAGLRNLDKTILRRPIFVLISISLDISLTITPIPLSLPNKHQSIYQSYIANHPHPAQWRSHGIKLQHVYQCKQIIRFTHTL